MRPVAHGRPDTPVIPDGWAAAHRPTLDATHHDVTIAWRRAGGTAGGTFDPATLQKNTTAAAGPYTTSDARVQVLSGLAQERLTAEDQVTVTGYQVTVDVDASDYHVGDYGTVTAATANADPTLLGRILHVRTVQRGSLAFERVLLCVEYLD